MKVTCTNSTKNGKIVSNFDLDFTYGSNTSATVNCLDSQIADFSVKTYFDHYGHKINIELTEKLKSRWNRILKQTLFDEARSDFIFIVEGERIPVNKFILSVRSPVFDRMFNSDFKESKSNEHELKFGIGKDAFKELIRYIYTEDVYDLDTHVLKLLSASEYFEIPDLKTFCEKEIQNMLKENNANEIFQAAHLYNCSSNLKIAAFNIIKSQFKKHNFELNEKLIDDPKTVNDAVSTLKNLTNIIKIND